MKQITKLLNRLWLYLESQVIHIIEAKTMYKNQLEELSTQLTNVRDSLEKSSKANTKLRTANNRINTKANYQASRFESLSKEIETLKLKNKDLIWKIALHNACHNK